MTLNIAVAYYRRRGISCQRVRVEYVLVYTYIVTATGAPFKWIPEVHKGILDVSPPREHYPAYTAS